jgi:hypothetical protein
MEAIKPVPHPGSDEPMDPDGIYIKCENCQKNFDEFRFAELIWLD